jgi:hypothetical protein
MERNEDELEGQGKDAEPTEPPVDGPGKGSQDDDLGDTSQDSPGNS